MNTYVKKIDDIRPTQLYICKEKLASIEGYIGSVGLEELDPLPVKTIGKKTFFTDGHTRAFALFKSGADEIEVYEDKDDLDWIEYLVCLDWCEQEKIHNIGDLQDKIIPEPAYNERWLDRCRRMQHTVKSDPDEFIKIETIVDPDLKGDITDIILRSLPQWFGIEDAIVEYVKGVRDSAFLTINIKNTEVGFISIIDHNEYTSEIYAMGIFKEFHRKGFGKKLLNEAVNKLKIQGKKFLTVKTLSDTHPDVNYKITRNFYKSMGFYPLQELPDLWGKSNPCLLMIKRLDDI